MSLRDLATQRAVVVCCGSGGVGKTTTAAAMAVEGARAGRRACVVTIDPARRLADALGLDILTNTPSRVDGAWPGELWALMLDTKTTFDSIVTRYAGSADQAKAILDNAIYRNIVGALSGTQEYMAMEKLHELHAEGRFDLIVIDTPPTRNALDFIDAPRRLTKFLENRLFRLLVTPTRAYLRAVSVATQAFLRTVSRVVGSEVVGDAVAFFQAFEGMEEGFRQRAQQVLDLLADPGTAFVLVASPRQDTVREAAFFAEKLQSAGIGVDALVVNRLHPTFGAVTGNERRRADELAATPHAAAATTLADFRDVARGEEAHFASLAARLRPAPVARVPFLPSDVHDLDGLAEVGRHLFRSD